MLNWREILEALAIHGGRAGLTKEAFTELLAKLYPGWNAVKVWDRLAKMTDCSLTDSGLLQVKSDVWEKIMSEGRAIKLSESALNILETIGMAGEAGIGCPDLSKKLKIDARNLHYHLNPLQQHGIIHKIPIALNKTNTSLCVLGRFVAEEDAGEGLGTSVIPGSRFRCTRAEMKEKITQILGSLPESRLTCRDIMRQLEVEQGLLRLIRRYLRELVVEGYIEVMMIKGICYKILPVYRFIRPYSRPQPKRQEAEAVETQTFASKFQLLVSFEKQLRDLVAESGSTGITLGEMKVGLGLSTKAIFRLHTRMTDGKSVVNSDVYKISEFHGKERRHRLFIKDHSSTTSDHQKATASPAPNKARDSITKTQRAECIIAIMNEHNPPLLEIGKNLGLIIGAQLAKLNAATSTYAVDKRTLSRTVSELEEQGKLRVIRLVMSGGVRQFVTPPGLDAATEARVQAAIEAVKQGPRTYNLTREPEPEPEEEISEPKPKLSSYGYIFGVMQRLKILHYYLWSKIGVGNRFDTPTVLFSQIPVGLFLQLVFMVDSSEKLEDYMLDPDKRNNAIDSLPSDIRNELKRRRGRRLRLVIRELLEMLQQLGLLSPADSHFLSNIEVNIPPTFHMSPMGHLPRPPDGQTHRVVPLSTLEDLHQYWTSLEESWSGKSEEFSIESLPPVLKKACFEINWQNFAPSRKRTRETAESNETKDRSSTTNRPILPRKAPTTLLFDSTAVKKRKAKPKSCDFKFSDPEKMSDLCLVFVLLQEADFSAASISVINWSLADDIIEEATGEQLRVHGGRLVMDNWTQMSLCRRLEAQIDCLKALKADQFRAAYEVESLTERLKSLFTLTKGLLQSFEAICATTVGIETIDRTEFRQMYANEGPSKIMACWHRKRHTRIPKQEYFDSIPFFVQPVFPNPTDFPSLELRQAVMDLRALMTWPADKYDATEASKVLAKYTKETLDAALTFLQSTNFVTKASKGRHRYRIPGTDFSLSNKITHNLMTVEAISVESVDHFQGDLTEEAGIDIFRFVDDLIEGSSVVDMNGGDIKILRQISEEDKLSQLLVSESDDEWLRQLPRGVPRIWFFPTGDQEVEIPNGFNRSILIAAIKLIKGNIKESGLIMRNDLNYRLWPALSDEEIGDVLGILEGAKIIATRDNDLIYFNT